MRVAGGSRSVRRPRSRPGSRHRTEQVHHIGPVLEQQDLVIRIVQRSEDGALGANACAVEREHRTTAVTGPRSGEAANLPGGDQAADRISGVTVGVAVGQYDILAGKLLEIAYRTAHRAGMTYKLVRGPEAPAEDLLRSRGIRRTVEDQVPSGGVDQQQIVLPLIAVDRP